MSYKYMENAISNNDIPITKMDLIEKFKAIGLNNGDSVIAHVSLNSLGYVIGGVETIYLALNTVLGLDGTMVVPTQTIEITDPSTWECPKVPENWLDIIRKNMPPFNINTSYSNAMGHFSNFIRTLPESVRSSHPAYSFSAIGKNARFITKDQPLNFPLGKNSPLEKLYDLNAKVLLIGTDFDSNTSIHLAENYINRETIKEKSKISLNGTEKWIEYDNIEFNIYDDFIDLQKSFYTDHKVNIVKVGKANIEAFNMKECVDFAKSFYKQKERLVEIYE